MTHQAILDYNNKLIAYNSNCDILEYIRYINSMYRKPMDLSFMADLLEYIENDTCCIPHTLLIKYRVFKEKHASVHVKKTLKLHEMISETDTCEHNIEYKLCKTCTDDIDYRLSNVREPVKQGGYTISNMYYLKPDTFKFILMRSKCEKKYAKYYLLLEKSIKYYHDYQKAYKEYIISQKDDNIKQLETKIDKQTEEMAKQTEEMARQTAKIDELLGYASDVKEDLNSLLDITIDYKLRYL